MAFDPQAQRRIMGHFATGVSVLTTRVEEHLCGMTANAVASLSLEPPLVLVAVDKRAHIHACLHQSKCFALNVLREDQEAISRRFAEHGPKEFDDLAPTTAVTGAPVLGVALAYVDCRLVEIAAGGDHDIFIGEIVAGEAVEGRPLIFYRAKYTELTE